MHLPEKIRSSRNTDRDPTHADAGGSRPRGLQRRGSLLVAGLGIAFLLLASLAPAAAGASVDPVHVPADKRVKSCTHFEAEDGAWTELRVNPGRNGVFTDGQIEITISGYDAKTFDWSANRSIVQAVYVRGGANDASFLYEYGPGSGGDTDLTTPGAFNEIQYISFCYGDDEVPPEEEPCPTVTATAQAGPANELTWTAVDGATGYNVYRAVGGGTFELIASVASDTTTLEDEDVEQGQTYRYQVTALVDGGETRPCNTAEVTAIPVFPTAFAAVSASVVGLLAYVAVRRRT